MSVKTLDFTKFYGSHDEQVAFAQDLLEGFSGIGFVKLVNHGVSLEELSHLFAWVIRATHSSDTLLQVMTIARIKPSSVFPVKRKKSSPTLWVPNLNADGALSGQRRPAL